MVSYSNCCVEGSHLIFSPLLLSLPPSPFARTLCGAHQEHTPAIMYLSTVIPDTTLQIESLEVRRKTKWSVFGRGCPAGAPRCPDAPSASLRRQSWRSTVDLLWWHSMALEESMLYRQSLNNQKIAPGGWWVTGTPRYVSDGLLREPLPVGACSVNTYTRRSPCMIARLMCCLFPLI